MIGGFPDTSGENSRRAKLTQAQVDECRAAFERRGEQSTRKFMEEWAAKLNVHVETVRSFLRRRTWL